MSDETIRPRKFLAVIAGLGTLSLMAGAVHAKVTDEQFARLQAQVQREADAREVANVMGIRASLYSSGRGEQIAELFASKQADSSFSMNGNAMIVGIDGIRKAFGPNEAGKQRALDAIAKAWPQVENKPENLGVGDLRIHALISPIIEVAEDGRTAKGFWQTVGPQLQVSNGNPNATLAFESYGVDFIKEDGQWKIWHLAVFTDIYYDFGKSFADQLPKSGVTTNAAGPPGPKGPYQAWSPARLPQDIPLPKPYKSFSETFSYGPAAVTAK